MIDDAFRSFVLGLAPELAAKVREELGRPRMLPIKSCGVAYRQVLDAEKQGEIAVYRIGHGAFVDEAALHEWIKRAGVKSGAGVESHTVTENEPDEIAELIEMGDQRRKRRTG